MLDLGPRPSREADRLEQLLERREQVNKGRVPLGIAYLDDCLGGIHPGDLLLFASGTGVGKTTLATMLALSAVRAGLDPVYLFALEAEEGEIAARLYFQELGRRANNPHLDYAGWWRGQWPQLDEEHGPAIRAELAPLLDRMKVIYKGRGDFTTVNLSQQLEAAAHDAKMVVLDHLHMIEADSFENELKGQRKAVQTLRDMALEYKIPVAAASHIRKRDKNQQPSLLPDISDLHGSSNLSKVATHVVVFGREWDGPQPQRHLAPTLVKVEKDRLGRASAQVARIYYDQSEGRYETAYELGKLEWENRRQGWKATPTTAVPAWAANEARVLVASKEQPF
jgi:replicative DNA helicase